METTQQILDAIDSYLKEHIIYRKQDRTVHTLLIYGTYFVKYQDIPVFDNFPIIFFKSINEDSGKTRALEVTEQLAYNAKPPGSFTAASLLRMIDKIKPDVLTWLFDEADETLISNKDNSDYIRLLNNGYARGKVIVRCDDKDDVIETPAYFPKILAGLSITKLKKTTRSRIITIPMKPAKPTDHFKLHIDKELGASLKQRILSQHVDIIEQLKSIDEEKLYVDENGKRRLNNRNAQLWHPLLALAKLAGDEWFKKSVESVEIFISRRKPADHSERKEVFKELYRCYRSGKHDKGIHIDTFIEHLQRSGLYNIEKSKVLYYFGEEGYGIPSGQLNLKIGTTEWRNKTGIRWSECIELFDDNLTDEDKEEILGEYGGSNISTNSTSINNIYNNTTTTIT